MFYPNITDASISQFQVVINNLRLNPQYLDSEGCPYSESVKAFFNKLGGGGEVVLGGNVFDEVPGEEKTATIERQIGELIHDLNKYASQLKTGDNSEKLAYFKTKASLVEKLVSLQERVTSLKEISEFQSTVIGFLEEICTKDQVTQLMKRLGK